ncbi:CLUMA_CG016625, isoform A [Clunio marinus]|uniref:CLUMA_CG016625, isoform A n=1 Tax=Clunio marinus TaxID=568069 RepID=A0A1J1ISU2_9DIPT|nr:CLUMA_CG016625, isoform A [Clunio marinus]
MLESLHHKISFKDNLASISQNVRLGGIVTTNLILFVYYSAVKLFLTSFIYFVMTILACLINILNYLQTTLLLMTKTGFALFHFLTALR